MLVEDDDSLGFLLKDSMEGCGWQVSLYADGEKGLTAFHNQNFDLCILDVMLPQKDGFELAAEIRRYNQQIPIIFLTAKGHVDDRIRGFQIGADDYVSKPFSIEELKCRIDAILKRSLGMTSASDRNMILRVSSSVLDMNNRVLTCNGMPIRVTYKEAKLLQLFFRHAGKLIERDVFLKAVWEDDGFFVARSMDVFVSRLRKYLRGDPRLRIDNIRGVGYILKHEPTAVLS